MAVTPKEQREELRRKIFASKKPKSQKVTFRGEEIEVRQPSVRLVMQMTSEEDKGVQAVMMLINYAFIPGTDVKVFDPEDVDALIEMPWDEDWTAVNTAIVAMTGINLEVDEGVKNSS
jgi:hypothetical protein